MPQYALLIYGPTAPYEQLSEEATRQMYARHAEFGAMLEQRGIVRGGAELAFEGRTLRQRKGQALITQGPFAETAEVLGGFYLVEVADLDEATEVARAVPALATDVVEVRRVLGADDRPG